MQKLLFASCQVNPTASGFNGIKTLSLQNRQHIFAAFLGTTATGSPSFRIADRIDPPTQLGCLARRIRLDTGHHTLIRGQSSKASRLHKD